ncbi:MAG: hypothetical protein NVS9B12_04380 [Vulcanimicrobiaceae bacterium]
MKNSFLAATTGLSSAALVLALTACGGGGGSGSPGVRGSTQPPPPPPAAGRPYQVRIVIGFSGARSTETVPGNGNNLAIGPAGSKDGGPVPGARITYPDNSTQVADAGGVFVPSASSYAQKNQKFLQTNPNAQPLVVVSVPAGKTKPSTARVAAYASAPVVTAAVLRSPSSATLGMINNLAGVSLLQPTSSMFSSDVLDLDVQGSDVHDNVVDLSSAQISYASAAGGQIVPIPGTTEAYYLPPAVGSGSITDSITVTVTVPNTTTQFTSSNNVVVVAAANAVALTGTLETSGGSAMPGSVALFAQLSKYFPPNYWLSAADDKGNYAANVPSSQLFNLVVGAPAAFSPSGNFDFYVGSSDSAGAVSSFNSGPGPSAALNLFLPASAVPFNNAPSAALPSFVGFVRDAWYNTVDASTLRIFEAGTGIQPLLAAVPATFPSPAAPVAVGSGQLATWCYQWQQPGGVPTLVLVEATGPNCTQPGNDAFTIAPAPGGSFSYVKYTSNTTYQVSSPLDVTTNTQIVESGTWQQSLTGSPAISSDLASVNVQLYDVANQVLGSPVYNESLQYSYSLNPAGLSSELFSKDTRTSAADGSLVAVYDAAKTQTAPLASCAGTPSQCFSISGTVSENYNPTSGSFLYTYTIGGSINGDSSATLTYQSMTDASKVVIPLASDVQANASPYLLVGATAPGRVYDVDGISQIGSFTVNNARLVQFLVLDPTQGGAQVDSLGFIL